MALSKTLRGTINNLNGVLQAPLASKECRRGISMAIETILFDCKAYKGYCYLTEHDLRDLSTGRMPDGVEPGIIFGIEEGNSKVVDEWRRHYQV